MSSAEDLTTSELRDRSRSLRDAIDPLRRLERSEAAHAKLYELERFRDADSLAIYFSTGSEVLTGPLAVRLAEHESKRLLLPFVQNDALQLAEWRPSDPVVDAAYGGMQPRYCRAVALDDIDVIVVSGLAFDRTGGRLGEGAGLVDGLLSRLPAHTYRIGLAFPEQIVEAVPVRMGDERMHVIATGDELVVCDGTPAATSAR
jgi:5-formyltetrahydrofolate cyclo-ligase